MVNKSHGAGWPISGKEATKKRKKQRKVKEERDLPSPPAWQGWRNE